jgi:uncharacterized protein YdcH (DUF465 family)
MRFEEIKDILLQQDEEFRRLADEHRQFDQELKDLSSRKYLAPQDQLREVELKKRKLQLKDRMLEIAADYRKEHQREAGSGG